MTVVGGSHTAFDTGAFTVGAVGGAGLLAGAVGAGLANFRAAQAERYQRMTVEACWSAMDYYEAQLARARDHIADLEQENVRLRVAQMHQTDARQVMARRALAARR